MKLGKIVQNNPSFETAAMRPPQDEDRLQTFSQGHTIMEIGFIGLGKMGFPMARRLVEAGHQLIVFDQRKEASDKLEALGAAAASSPKDVADRAETVLASLPSLQASLEVATGAGGVIEGKRIKRFVDLSTVGSGMAVRIHDLLAKRNIVQLDCPVSGGVGGAEKGTLAVMVSGPKADFEALKPALEVIGKVFFIGEKPGSAQTMKLANNLLSATAVVATSEAVVMGVKSGLDPAVMIDVINSGSGMNTASRDKFPRAILPRSFDFGFATGLMVKDVRLFLEEAKTLGMSMEVAEAVGRLWEVVIREMGAESDFTTAIKPIEKAAGVVVGGAKGAHAAK
jgi:3-hydroxyisobutyrate dehydrogenase-like beta-hydroxyacid dehydrogenase